MKSVIEYDDIIAFHPGYYVKEMIDLGHVDESDARELLYMNEMELWMFTNGGIDVDEQLAERLHDLTGTSAALWINLQNAYNRKYNEIRERRR